MTAHSRTVLAVACFLALTLACLERLPQASRTTAERIFGTTKFEKTGSTKPRFEIPNIRLPSGNITYVQQTVSVRGTKLRVRAFFAEGRFVGAESVEKIEDPRRMSIEVVERGMSATGEIVVGAPASDPGVDLGSIWEKLASRIDLSQIREFSVCYVTYRFHDGSERPALIFNIWGPENPLGMPDDLAPGLKNRIRIVYDLENQSYGADNLL